MNALNQVIFFLNYFFHSFKHTLSLSLSLSFSPINFFIPLLCFCFFSLSLLLSFFSLAFSLSLSRVNCYAKILVKSLYIKTLTRGAQVCRHCSSGGFKALNLYLSYFFVLFFFSYFLFFYFFLFILVFFFSSFVSRIYLQGIWFTPCASLSTCSSVFLRYINYGNDFGSINY